MEFKYTEQQTKNQDNNTVNMLLFGEIGEQIHAQSFINEMEWHNKSGKQIQLKINSVGGSVFDGYGIMNAVEEMGADTYIVGLAASMAGVIAQVGKTRKANHRAVFMAHAPTGGSKDLRAIISKTLTRELTDRSVLSEDEVKAIMEGGKDTFYDAEDMYSKGLIDQLITTGAKLTNVVNKTDKELFEAYDSLINLKSNKMKNVLMQLGLPENKTEADIVSAVEVLQDQAEKVTNLETENSELQAELKELKDKAQADLVAKATDLVKNAVKTGKCPEDKEADWIEAAIENFDLVSNTLGSISVAPKKTVSVVDKAGSGEQVDNSDKDYEWMAKNDPEGLADILENEPEKYEALEKAYVEK